MNTQERQNFLAQLIQLDTVGEHEDRVANFLKREFEKHGITCKLIPIDPDEPGRHIFYAEMGNGKGTVLAFSGHQDVVSLGDPKKWTVDPLGAEVKDGKMYGRGTSDMKSGLAAEAIAMMELADEGYQINGKLLFLGTVGEESSPKNHMQGAQTLAKHGYTKNIDAMIIGEPSNGDVVFATKGSVLYKVTSEGIAAHSSTPEAGFDAIAPLIAYYQLQNDYFQTMTQENEYLGKTTPVVSKIDGGGQLNSVADHAEIFVKIRTIPELSNDDILQQAKIMIQQINTQYHAKLSLEILGDKIPVSTEPDDSFIQLAKNAAKTITGVTPKLHGISADTDASEMTKVDNNFAVTIFGPGNESIHKPNENVDLKQYDQFVDIYKEVVKRYFA